MNRYSSITLLRNENPNVGTLGTQYYKTTFYPEIPLSENDIYVITDFGDRLDLLANQFYNDSTGWPIIATANNLGQGTLNVEAGIQIRIPDPTKFRDYIIQLNKFNSQR